jgi:hypothetical protein
VVGFCEHGNEPLGSVKVEGFLYYVSILQASEVLLLYGVRKLKITKEQLPSVTCTKIHSLVPELLWRGLTCRSRTL